MERLIWENWSSHYFLFFFGQKITNDLPFPKMLQSASTTKSDF